MAKRKPNDSRYIHLFINTGYSGANYNSKQPLPEGWDEMDEVEQSQYLEELRDAYVTDRIKSGAYVTE